jgi:hypothetical protein
MTSKFYLVGLVCSSLMLVSGALWLSIGLFEVMERFYVAQPPIEERTELIEKAIERARSEGVSESYISILSATKEAEEAKHATFKSFTEAKTSSIEVLILLALLHFILLFRFIKNRQNA